MDRSCASSEPSCPVARAIAVLQEKWVLHIVHTLLSGPRGFNELGREVGGCNPTTLTQRLARLEEVGLVMRTHDLDGAARSGYALTPAGEALSDVIEAIHAWSVRHLEPDEHDPTPMARLRAAASAHDEPVGDALSAG
jgi:DNA-binding HxlR family transcriptional regulator